MKKLVALSLLIVSACSLVPEYERPATAAPTNWSTSQKANTELTKDWWKKYNNSELDNLISQALTNNKDLEAGIARIQQARAASKIAGSNLLPNTSASASTSKDYESDGSNRSNYNTGLDINYEADLFGKNRANADAAESREKATIFDQDALTLVITSDIANYYADYLSMSDRIWVAQKNLENGKKVLNIVQAKYDEGKISALELSQQRTALANLESSITGLNNQRDIAKSRLAVLTGLPPQNIALTGKSITELNVPLVKPIQPGELLERRPDIRSAEENLKAANIDIGATKADFYPNLQIGANTALAATGLSNPASLAAGLLVSLTQSIFSGGALEGNLEQTEARKKELAANYSNLVITSYKEVEDALSSVNAAQQNIRSRTTAREQSQKAYDIAKIRYDEGKTDFQILLDTQSSLFGAEDNFYSGKADAVKASVTLYKSLGGGWQEN